MIAEAAGLALLAAMSPTASLALPYDLAVRSDGASGYYKFDEQAYPTGLLAVTGPNAGRVVKDSTLFGLNTQIKF